MTIIPSLMPITATGCVVGFVLLAGVAHAQASPQQGITAAGRSAGQRASVRKHTGKSASVANSKVEVIGGDSSNPRGTVDHPLLPIASMRNGLAITSGTPIQVRLSQAIDSGHVHNGDTVNGTLAQPVANQPAGTPVKLTVVQASPAGALVSYGELSIQVISIGDHPVLSDTISAQGKEGKKEQADSAPARGTEAGFSADQVISLPAS